MALRPPTLEEIKNHKAPEGAEIIYYRNDFDKGGPVLIAYVEKDVPPEVRAANYARQREEFARICRDIAQRLAANKNP